MGRGKGGYTTIQTGYRDSGGRKVTDPGSVFVAERYIDAGYESVFRQRHEPQKTYDLTIKTSDDSEYVKNIEVKRLTSNNPSVMAKRIGEAFTQFSSGREDTVAIVLPNLKNNGKGLQFAKDGYSEALRKGFVKGNVEVWFSDKTKIEFIGGKQKWHD